MEELDEMDRRILATLDFDARMGYTALGKKLGKTKQYVRHRVERLKKRGIITNIHTVVDVTKLGYLYIRMLIKLRTATQETEQEMITYFKNYKECGWLVSLGGAYDLAAVIMVKSMADYEKILDAFSTQFHESLDKVETAIATRVWHYPHKVLREQPPHEQLVFGEDPQDEELDSTDKKILTALLEDGTANSVTLGQKVDLSPAAVLARLRRLEKDRIILAYRLSIDTEKLGYQKYKAFLAIHLLDDEFLKEFTSYCRDNKAILYITKAIGPHLLEFEAIVTNNKEFNTLIKNVRSHFPAIKDVQFAEEYETHLISYTPF